MDIDDVTREKSLDVADQMIRFLNELMEIDPDALHKLIETRVPCNTDLAEHPTVQVQGTQEKPCVGLLGILNGFVGADNDGWGFVCASFDDDTGKLTGFMRTPLKS